MTNVIEKSKKLKEIKKSLEELKYKINRGKI